MPDKPMLVDLARIDFTNILADATEIRRLNQQRFEMEQLTAVVYEDMTTLTSAGYKDVTDQEFWVRGHMPGMPLMPGVIMIEAAAQLCSYFCMKHDLLGAQVIGLGGLEEVRFRDPVLPGDRLVLMCQQDKVRYGKIIYCHFQGAVRGRLVLDGLLKGVPLPVDAMKSLQRDVP